MRLSFKEIAVWKEIILLGNLKLIKYELLAILVDILYCSKIFVKIKSNVIKCIVLILVENSMS